jgi:hypothetical protein
MEESRSQPERRSQPRYAVDAEATLVIVNHGATIRGRIYEISLDGCRIRADRHYSTATPAGIEVMFKINGIAFRLGGTMQWASGQQTAGIQFGAMAPRRRDAVVDLLAELEAEEQAKAAKADAEPSSAGVEATNPPVVEASESRKREPAKPEPQSIADSSKNLTAAKANAEPAAKISRPPATGRERRQQTRHAVDTRATVFFIDVRAQITGRILDLSMSGGRIRTDERFPVGIYRRVETEFNLDGLPFRLGGVVQSIHDKFTVGIRFLDLSPRKRDQLMQLMDEIEEMRQTPKAHPEGSEASLL